MLLHRWVDTFLHDFHGHGDQNCVFSGGRNFWCSGRLAPARAEAAAPKLRPSEKNTILMNFYDLGRIIDELR